MTSRLGPSGERGGVITASAAWPSRGFSRAPDSGFALLTVLWLIVVLSGLVGLSLATTRLGHRTTANRIQLARGRWAAEACVAVAQARWAKKRLADTATVDLGQGKTCAWQIEDPTARVNVNTGDRELLEEVLSTVSGQPTGDSIAERIMMHRATTPFDNVEELRVYLTDITVADLLTVDGPGTVNVNAAPSPVLAVLPGMTNEAVERVVYRRNVGRPIQSLDELAGELSPPARATLLARYADLARLAVFTPPQVVLTVRGSVAPEGGPDGLHATIEVLVVPLPERLAVVRRRMW